MDSNKTIRPGEILAVLPDQLDAGVYFVGRIRTPWATRDICPRRGDPSGPECRIELDPRWERALEGLAAYPRIEVLYWMHQARRDLLIQVPRVSGKPRGTFALRSPVQTEFDCVFGCRSRVDGEEYRHCPRSGLLGRHAADRP